MNQWKWVAVIGWVILTHPEWLSEISMTLFLHFLISHDAFLPLVQCGRLQRGGPLLPSWPTVPATSAQTVIFINTYCTTSSPTPHEHTCKHLPPVRTGLVVGDVILRNSRHSSISRTQVFLQMSGLNQGLMLLVCST